VFPRRAAWEHTLTPAALALPRTSRATLHTCTAAPKEGLGIRLPASNATYACSRRPTHPFPLACTTPHYQSRTLASTDRTERADATACCWKEF